MKNEYKIDVAVLILFFARHEQLEKVFEQVKLARPSRLYLYQDGAREGREDDVMGIQKCRDIVDDSQIDWDCEVHRLYQDKNYGCDPSEYMAQKWMFETEEMGIVLEDDDVPSQSFFPFCKELLIRYKEDGRINMICGMNNSDVSLHIKESYLFTKKGSIWGWASWKRVLDSWDEEYSWLDSTEKLQIIKNQLPKNEYIAFINTATRHRESGRAHYESINAAAMFINDRLNIVSQYNMITNIGVSSNSTHSVDDVRLLPKFTQKLLYKKKYEIDFPLIHPSTIIRDVIFEKKMTRSKIGKLLDRLESLLRSLYYQGAKKTMERISKKLNGK